MLIENEYGEANEKVHAHSVEMKHHIIIMCNEGFALGIQLT